MSDLYLSLIESLRTPQERIIGGAAFVALALGVALMAWRAL